MLEIKNVSKVYETEDLKQIALDKVSINFRECEFTAILGPSGSGKTTLLNIIGGLDHYTSGDLIINEISTKKYKDSDWDSYRNHRIGFVFQNYNLIGHQTILSNVLLALKLSGISKKEATNLAKKALKDVGLEKHINKRPNQLSGGQMQRVAIARALVNNPDILLADEPTGALDSETSVQIMNLLKKISKDKLVIMVTHNPELAHEYSNRIITLKDGKITSDTNPYDGKKESKKMKKDKKDKIEKTSMSFKTALGLSFNNLMTKKGRTILVSFAGSIGIIGIALILSLSTGFQNYINKIQEDTLSSYPLTITQESTDITGMLLSMTTGNNENNGSNKVIEQQYITSMFSNIKANDLKSFKKYLENNYNNIKNDISSIKYSYNIDPLIYTIDSENNLAKVNPSSLFSAIYGSSMLSSYSSLASVYTQIVDDKKSLEESYDVLAGKWPEKYNEMVVVLSEPNSISDLLVYSLGLRDNRELTNIINKLMTGEAVQINNEPLELTYEDLLDVNLKLIMPSDTYKYNSKYKIYEDMSEDESYMRNLYKNAVDLKIVGVVTSKPGVTSLALNPGVAYTSDLIDYIIDYAQDSEIVKKQLENEEIDVFSNTRFDSKNSKSNLDFSKLVSVDQNKLKSAFNMDISKEKLVSMTSLYMEEINNAITTDLTPAKDSFNSNFISLSKGMFDSIKDKVSMSDAENVVNSYLNLKQTKNILSKLEKEYVLPSETFKTTYKGLLQGLLQTYISAYYMFDQSLTEDINNITAVVNDEIVNTVLSSYMDNTAIMGTSETMAKYMTEALMKKTILTKVGEMTTKLTETIASSLKVDEKIIASAFKININESELSRVMNTMMTNTDSNATVNLSSLGYQDKDEPTYISFYFNSFDGKEKFLSFIDSYNDLMKSDNNEDKVINYSDTTGILMDSVKTIVNAVTYVLIAFVSVSLVVSSIMIGIITYISVYERTKEIGILRAIGASKHNISSIFNAETFIIGLLSGAIGIGITYSIIPIINIIIHHFIGNIPLNAKFGVISAIILVVLSIVLTLIGGLIPSRKASKKDPVEALRSE
ncbi:MAG: ABC transporter ATP-binding protein/permease [bacterium]|nr:ABC transporter ATP-binding protein/permease [bacterium]